MGVNGQSSTPSHIALPLAVELMCESSHLTGRVGAKCSSSFSRANCDSIYDPFLHYVRNGLFVFFFCFLYYSMPLLLRVKEYRGMVKGK